MNVHIQLNQVGLRLVRRRYGEQSLKGACLQWLRGRRGAESPGAFWPLRDINLAVQPGERVGIVGANGSGKSTLLRVIAGIYRPTCGTVSRSGFLVPLLQADVGMSSELTARENILQAGAILGLPRQQLKERIDPILDFAELREVADVPVKYFSRGMQVRLAFTTATEVRPQILLLDEVFSGGDMAFREKALARMEELIGRTEIVLLASHSAEIVQRVCTRALWIREGRLALDGPPDEVVAAYRAAHQPARPLRERPARPEAAASRAPLLDAALS